MYDGGSNISDYISEVPLEIGETFYPCPVVNLNQPNILLPMRSFMDEDEYDFSTEKVAIADFAAFSQAKKEEIERNKEKCEEERRQAANTAKLAETSVSDEGVGDADGLPLTAQAADISDGQMETKREPAAPTPPSVFNGSLCSKSEEMKCDALSSVIPSGLSPQQQNDHASVKAAQNTICLTSSISAPYQSSVHADNPGTSSTSTAYPLNSILAYNTNAIAPMVTTFTMVTPATWMSAVQPYTFGNSVPTTTITSSMYSTSNTLPTSSTVYSSLPNATYKPTTGALGLTRQAPFTTLANNGIPISVTSTITRSTTQYHRSADAANTVSTTSATYAHVLYTPPTYSSTTATQAAVSEQPIGQEILQPKPAAQHILHKRVSSGSSHRLRLEDFETATSSPFDSVAIRSLNDKEELYKLMLDS